MKIKLGHKKDVWYLVTSAGKIVDVAYTKAKAEELLAYYLGET